MAATITHELFHALAARLKPDEAVELGAELPDELGDLLAPRARQRRALGATSSSRIWPRASTSTTTTPRPPPSSVLSVVREAIEPTVEIEQVLETLPPDLAQLMQ